MSLKSDERDVSPSPLSQSFDVRNSDGQELLFAGISAPSSNVGLFGKLFSAEGVIQIAWAADSKRQRSVIKDTIETAGSLRRSAGDRSLFVSHVLPSSEDLYWLCALKVRTFVFRELMLNLRYDESRSAKIFMDGYLHQTIHHLSTEGISFFQVITLPSGGETQVREFYRGFWCLEDAKHRAEKVTTFINMYGWARDELLSHSESEVERLFRGLSELLEKNSLAIMHGKGGGYMGLADEIARKLNIISAGVGIDLEQQGEVPNFQVDLALDFWSDERAYRQKVLDQLGLIKIFNIGGYGTLEEIAITVSSYKLLENVPAPIVLVDESISKNLVSGNGRELTQHLWADLRSQIDCVGDVSGFVYPSGKTVDISFAPLGLRWLKNVVHCVGSYGEAAVLLERFVRDPLAYWRESGISDFELQICWNNYIRRMRYYGFSAPQFLRERLEST
jgi:predicted Rossmann-fold nucleotide-binding protein